MIQPYPESSANAFYYYGKTLFLITKQRNEEALPVIQKGILFHEIWSEFIGSDVLFQSI
jgi:hypothetical protein